MSFKIFVKMGSFSFRLLITIEVGVRISVTLRILREMHKYTLIIKNYSQFCKNISLSDHSSYINMSFSYPKPTLKPFGIYY